MAPKFTENKLREENKNLGAPRSSKLGVILNWAIICACFQPASAFHEVSVWLLSPWVTGPQTSRLKDGKNTYSIFYFPRILLYIHQGTACDRDTSAEARQHFRWSPGSILCLNSNSDPVLTGYLKCGNYLTLGRTYSFIDLSIQQLGFECLFKKDFLMGGGN